MDTFTDLPEVYFAESGERIAEPVYALLAPGFYGATYYNEGEHIIFPDTPNHHMQPLNRAAGAQMAVWLEGLPGAGQNSTPEDLIEAAMMLRPREGEPVLNHQEFNKAVIKLAAELKAKRDGRGAPALPSGQVPRPATNPTAPPMANARTINPRAHTMGQTEETVHVPRTKPRQAVKPSPAMAALPKQEGQQQAG